LPSLTYEQEKLARDLAVHNADVSTTSKSPAKDKVFTSLAENEIITAFETRLLAQTFD